MEFPTYLLLVLGCLGAADIALFHSVAHGIRSHADSVGELVTHSLRGPTYAALFLFIPNFKMCGLYAWSLGILFAFDVGISVWDFSLEQHSRRFLGGLPSGEYVLHMLMAIVYGALVMAFLNGSAAWFAAPTQLAYAPAAVPILIRSTLAIMAVGVVVSGIQDAVAAIKLSIFRPSPSPNLQEVPATRALVAAPDDHRVKHVQAGKPWMQLILVAAGIYNLVWGAWVVCFPEALFRWAGVAPINYPQVWQCVGMIVGVYGLGYLLAARDPLRHWPIVLVGLLGKILGPVGMWWSVSHGTLPATMAWTCLTNDLIWWVPFAAILASAGFANGGLRRSPLSFSH